MSEYSYHKLPTINDNTEQLFSLHESKKGEHSTNYVLTSENSTSLKNQKLVTPTLSEMVFTDF